MVEKAGRLGRILGEFKTFGGHLISSDWAQNTKGNFAPGLTTTVSTQNVENIHVLQNCTTTQLLNREQWLGRRLTD